MKKVLLVFFVCIQLNARADLLLGLHAEGDKLAYASKKKLTVMSVSKDSVLQEKELVNDPEITDSVYRKALQMLKIQETSQKEQLRISVSDFSIVNLTYFSNSLYVGIRFYKGEFKKSKLLFGLLKLDHLLNLQNYYLFNSPNFHTFTLLPFFPLEFTDVNHLALPDMDFEKMVIKSFRLNHELHEIKSQELVKTNIQLQTYNQVMFPEGLIFDPLLYPVQGSAYRFYFQFPHPVVFTDAEKKELDPFGRASLFDGSNVKGQIQVSDGRFLLFDRQIGRDTLVMLTSRTENDSLFFLCSSHDPNLIYYFYYCISKRQYSFRMIRVPSVHHYFLLQNKRQIAFFWKDNAAELKIFNY